MSYAEKTTVPIGRSQDEIRKILTKYGASAFGIAEAQDRAMLTFDLKGKRIMFKLPLPKPPSANATGVSIKTYEQLMRTAWRALVLAIKAKLECVASGITTLEQEFLAHIVLPDGRIFGELYIPQIEQCYKTKQMPPLLEGR